MMMRLTVASAILAAVSVSAHAAAPTGTKLSEIIAKIEQTPDFHYVDEVDWSDRGHYEIEYYLMNGTKVEVRIDPATGKTVK